ncbi:MAG TPA: hypothetical protein VGQ42_18065 [Candidatus Dormibacteraeota bacterium]|jgi:hypothetical protein|nr:hypothetical protein [Candidatus Dormibacteraeota bacterium]
MGRVIHVRIHGLDPDRHEALQEGFEELAATRDWRGDRPWLADAATSDLFQSLFFADAAAAAERDAPEAGPLSAAGFVRLNRDETDALALLFILRDLSERLAARVLIRDADNPIAKLRHIELRAGLLPDGAQLEAVLVARPIFKRLPGAVIEMYPPRALGSAFGTVEATDERRRSWSFLVHGMRATAPNFLEAEAEAMRIYRGLRFLS